MENDALREEFEGFKNFQAQNLFNRLVDLRNSIEISEQSLIGKIKNIKGTKETALKVLDEVKNKADILGILPSAKKLLKIFNDLRTIAVSGGLNIEELEDNIFIQKYYKFFYQSRLGFSKDIKKRILESGDFIKSVNNIYMKFKPADRQFKAIVSIFALQIKYKADVKFILAQYANSNIIRANIELIAVIAGILHENKSLHLLKSDFVNFLTIASLVKKTNLVKNQKKALIDNMKLYIESKNIKQVADNIIANKTVKKRINGNIAIELFVACEIFAGDKSVLDVEVDEKFVKTVSSLKTPAKNYIKVFNKTIESIDISTVTYLIANIGGF